MAGPMLRTGLTKVLVILIPVCGMCWAKPPTARLNASDTINVDNLCLK